jgi:hypothetical protein
MSPTAGRGRLGARAADHAGARVPTISRWTREATTSTVLPPGSHPGSQSS